MGNEPQKCQGGSSGGQEEAGDFWPVLWASARRTRAGRAFQREQTTIPKAQRSFLQSALRSREDIRGAREGLVAGEEVERWAGAANKRHSQQREVSPAAVNGFQEE